MGFFSLDVQDNIMNMEDKDFKDSSSDEFSSMDSGEEEEEVNSSISSSSTSSLSHSNSPSSDHPTAAAGDDPLNDMSSLLQQLPFKRGLSKYYEGKSKSFTCLSNVRSLEDLAKPENPYNKKLKSCKSRSNLHKSASSKLISKKISRASCSSLITKRINMINKPPTHPPSRSNSTTHFSNQTPIQIQTQTQNQTPLFV